MKSAADSPGVVVPPPLFYVATFFLSLLLQRLFPVNFTVFHSLVLKISAITVIGISLVFIIPALLQFKKTRNTVVTARPANLLQVSGIYSKTRNPMYLGLLLLYIGIALLTGNWWTLMLIPLLILVVTLQIIMPEERYLLRAFGDPYSSYKLKVRRWL